MSAKCGTNGTAALAIAQTANGIGSGANPAAPAMVILSTLVGALAIFALFIMQLRSLHVPFMHVSILKEQLLYSVFNTRAEVACHGWKNPTQIKHHHRKG